jgi:hypothetical protein
MAQQGNQGNMNVKQYLPPGQRLESWSDMVTVITMRGAARIAPRAMLEQMRRQMEINCDKVWTQEPLTEGTENGYPYAVLFLSCSRSRQFGKAEVMLTKIVAGRDATYHVQRIWRSEPIADPARPPIGREQLREAQMIIQLSRVCDDRDAAHACANIAPRTPGS